MTTETFQIRPDDRALLDVLSDGAPESLPGLAHEQWAGLTDSAHRHGVAAFLYRNLASRGFKPPGDVVARLRRTYLGSTARNSLIFGKLTGILEAFAGESIPVIALKGAALAEPFYGSPGSRPMGDVDLLVDRGNLLRGKALLERHGLSQIRRIPPEQEIEVWHHLSPFRDGGGESSLVIELHWRLLRPGFPCPETADLWPRAGKERIAGAEVATLGKEDLILYTCLHALEHGYTGGLKSLLDLKVILDREAEGTNWKLLGALANGTGTSGAVAMGILLVRDLFEVHLPSGANAFLEGRKPDPALVEKALRQIFDSRGADHPVSANLSRLRHTGGFSGKAGVALRRLFPPRRELAARYGTSLQSPFFPLLHATHPFTMLWIHARGGLDLLLGREAAAAADEGNVRKEELVRNLLKG